MVLDRSGAPEYFSPVMSSPLPDLLDPWRAVDSRSVFSGRLPLSKLPRLCVLLLDKAGDVAFELAFSRDEERRALVHCEVAANLKLCCQRCLEGIDYEAANSALLAVVSGIDEEHRLPKRYDPLLVSDRLIRPRDLIEDELLLALPQIPMHEPGHCNSQLRAPDEEQGRIAGMSPFAVLAEIKRER